MKAGKSASSPVTKKRSGAAKTRRTQQERTEESREKLLAAAMELIGERGYQGTTLADIGQRAGVSRGLVTYHFGTKEACIREVLQRIRTNARFFAELEQSGKKGLAALDQLLAGYLRGYLARLPGARAHFVAMVESFTSTPELHDIMRQHDESFRSSVAAILDEAKDLGEVPDDADAHSASILIVGLARGVALQWLVDEHAIDLDSLIANVQRVARDSVSAHS